MVVHLDVKKAFDHVDHRAAFKATRLQGVSPFSMALIAAIWNGGCMKAQQSPDEQRFASKTPESLVIFPMFMELVLRDLIKSWISWKLAWRLDHFVLAAICFADHVVLVAASVAAAEVMVAEVIAKLKEVGLTVSAQKNTLDKSPDDDRQKDRCGRTGYAVEGGLGICGIEGVFGRKCKIRDCTQNSSSQQVFGEVENRFEGFMAPSECCA